MATNWLGLTLKQHIARCAYLWFAVPFTREYWRVVILEIDDGEGGYRGNFNLGYSTFAFFFTFSLFGLLWVVAPILFPIVTFVSRILCQKRARKLVINALRAK